MLKDNYVQTEVAGSIFEGDVCSEVGCATGIDYEYSTCINEFCFDRYSPSGILVLNPRPTQGEMSKIYPENYEPYQFEDMRGMLAGARRFIQKTKIKEIRKWLPDGAKVLDIGCGSGSLLRLLASVDNGLELHANDLYFPNVEKLESMGISVHQCSYEAIDKNEYFDLIVLNQVIEHFPHPDKVIAACYKLLKSGGVILIETPSTDGVDAKLFSGSCWGGYHFPRHFYLFNEKNLSRLLREQGFDIEKSDYLLSPAFWTQSLHHFLYRYGFKRISKLFHLKNILLTCCVVLVDCVSLAFGRSTSNMRLVGKK